MRKYLLDTNVMVHYLIEGEHADDVERFIMKVGLSNVAITLYSVYSIGILFTRVSALEKFGMFIDVTKYIEVVSIPIEELTKVILAAQKYKLDFDDAYQYVAAEKYDLTIVSYDSDFNRTPRGRKTPEEILNEL